MYEYKAKIISVYDGDTCRADIDLGFGIVMKNQSIRLYGIDTPELRGEEREQGIISRDRLRELILGKDVTIKTYKDKTGKYGRYLATIYIDEIDVNNLLLTEGLAQEYK